ncbi:hypothetical protein QJQ45_028556 [Haematococcus lacustris]|nr:hypothetical protein QJQ45_028556 [Haematococcus lacustris]
MQPLHAADRATTDTATKAPLHPSCDWRRRITGIVRAFTPHPGTSSSYPIAVHSAASAIQCGGKPASNNLDLSAPGMCASQLLALNTTALLNTSLTAQELMPGLGYFAMDVAQLLRDYLNDSNIVVQVTDFCAGNRTAASFIDNRTLVNGPWPTLNVTITFITAEPESSAAVLCPVATAPDEMVLLAAVVAAGNTRWDSYQMFEAADATGLRYCGGPFDFPVAANDNIFPFPCDFGPGLSTMTNTLRIGTTYWVVSTPQLWGNCLLLTTIAAHHQVLRGLFVGLPLLSLSTTLQQAGSTAMGPHPPRMPMSALPKNTTSCLQ